MAESGIKYYIGQALSEGESISAEQKKHGLAKTHIYFYVM